MQGGDIVVLLPSIVSVPKTFNNIYTSTCFSAKDGKCNVSVPKMANVMFQCQSKATVLLQYQRVVYA